MNRTSRIAPRAKAETCLLRLHGWVGFVSSVLLPCSRESRNRSRYRAASATIAGGICISHRGGAIGYPRSGGTGRRLRSPRRARLVADEHPAAYAGAGTLQAGVVRLYSVIVILGGGVHVGCARLSGVHEAPPRGPGLGVCQAAQFRITAPAATFGYVGRNRGGAAAKLSRQPVELSTREPAGSLVD
jgi:hypothetical protein